MYPSSLYLCLESIQTIMRRNILYGIIFLASINLYGQEAVDQIELFGKAVVGIEEAAIQIPDWQNINYIIAETL